MIELRRREPSLEERLGLKRAPDPEPPKPQEAKEPEQPTPAPPVSPQVVVIQGGQSAGEKELKSSSFPPGKIARAAGRFLLGLPSALADLLWWALDVAVVLLVAGLVAALAFPHTWAGETAAAAGRWAVQWLYEHAPWLFVHVRTG
ncbi:MAG: hypothetical protein QJR08_00490 [Bacillota bacterium]|nr:hypothetical protein [Bacillota bacterium]